MHSSKPVVQGWEFAAFAAAVPLQLDEALALMTFSGSLERHPKMKLVLGESGLGWIPYMLETHGPRIHQAHSERQGLPA